MEQKPCTKCGELLALSEFYRAKGTRDGLRGDCKSCFAARRRRNYDSDRAVAAAQRWRVENPERFADYQREYRARPERKRAMRDLYYRRTYGLSADEVDAMLEAQNGRCAICGGVPKRSASMHLDHDHEGGHLRGLLCLSCNQGLGKFRDDPSLLLRAVVYLRQREGVQSA